MTLSWSFLFVISAVRLLLALVPLGLLALHPGFRRRLRSSLVPPLPDRDAVEPVGAATGGQAGVGIIGAAMGVTAGLVFTSLGATFAVWLRSTANRRNGGAGP